MNRFVKTSLAVALAAALSLTAQAFEGQKPATPAPGAPAPSVMAAPAANGVANAPNANPIQKGGIQANQLAADDSALDKIMFASIESGNVDGVREALKAGINLRQDFSYACGSNGVFDANHPAEDKFFAIGSPDILSSNGDTVPGHCTKQHLLHAIHVASRLNVKEDIRMRATLIMGDFDPDRVARFSMPKGNTQDRGRVVEQLKALKQGRDNAYEILALLDANIPKADKAFYPAYLSRMTMSGQDRNPVVDRWVIDRYLEALPEIKRARSLKETTRMAWDAYKARVLAKVGDKPVSAGAPYELAVFDPSIIPKGDEGYSLKEITTSILIANREKFQSYAENQICARKLDLDRQAQNPAYTKNKSFIASRAELEFNQKYLADYVDAYTSKGLAARPYSRLENDLIALNESTWSQNQLGMWMHAVEFYQAHSLIAFLLERPEVIDGLNNKQTTPGGSTPPLNRVVGSWVEGSRTTSFSQSIIRAMLNAGVNPSLRDSNGKTAADLVIGTDPVSMWKAQAFLKKDLVDGGCRPGG
jgi:hypothetical protein